VSIRKIKDLLARMGGANEAPHLVVELVEEVGSLIDSLDLRIQDLQSIIGAPDLDAGSRSATLDLMVRGLAEEFTLPASREAVQRSREGAPIISFREMADVLVQGSDVARLPDWVIPAFRQITSILRNEHFPCIFARQANYLKSGWVCFVESVETQSGKEAVQRALEAYYDLLARSPRERTILMPMMFVVKPVYPMLSLKAYRDQAWGLFQFLHENDPEPWPIDVPTEPDRGDWSFCYGGMQLFSNVSDPAHKIHKSRNLGDSLVFAMQPRTNFDLVGGNNRKGRMVRNEIRERASRYEGRPPASHLGFYGTPDNREWKQMATKDSEADVDYPEVCPFHAKAKADKADKDPTQK